MLHFKSFYNKIGWYLSLYFLFGDRMHPVHNNLRIFKLLANNTDSTLAWHIGVAPLYNPKEHEVYMAWGFEKVEGGFAWVKEKKSTMASYTFPSLHSTQLFQNLIRNRKGEQHLLRQT